MSGILVVIEHREGRIARISWEAIAAANRIFAGSEPVTAVILGADTAALASEVAVQPVAKIIRIVHPLLAQYTPDAYTLALHQLIRTESPAYAVLPHTYQVRDYAPALAARLGQVLISDVVDISAPGDNASPIFTRQLMQGRLNGQYKHSGNGPCLISVQAGAFRADAPKTASSGSVGLGQSEMKVGQGFSPDINPQEKTGALAPEVPISVFTPAIDPSQIRTRPAEPFRGGSQTVDLGSAQLIVSVGRGIKEAENLPMVQDLATALGAELAASRPICDNGWLPMERQVGSSGQTVAPKLYLAVGISGAIQHLVGMRGSQCIVAINKDPDAPIFEVADYGIVGDLFEVVPVLTEAIKAARA